MGWLDSSWSVHNHRTLDTSITVHGFNGQLIITDDTIRIYLLQSAGGYDEGWTTMRKPDLESPVSIDIGGPHFTRQDQHFVDSIQSNSKVDNDVLNAFKTQNIIDAVYKSSDNNGQKQEIVYGDYDITR